MPGLCFGSEKPGSTGELTGPRRRPWPLGPWCVSGRALCFLSVSVLLSAGICLTQWERPGVPSRGLTRTMELQSTRAQGCQLSVRRTSKHTSWAPPASDQEDAGMGHTNSQKGPHYACHHPAAQHSDMSLATLAARGREVDGRVSPPPSCGCAAKATAHV